MLTCKLNRSTQNIGLDVFWCIDYKLARHQIKANADSNNNYKNLAAWRHGLSLLTIY